MRLPCLLQFRILKLALTSLFSRPYTTRYPAEPYEPIPQFRGRPRFSESDCVGCGACAEVCPSACIDVVDDTTAAPPMRRIVQHFESCICCGQCERYCPTQKGITLTNEFDFASFDPDTFEESLDKELLLCETCGCAIAPKAQINWLATRLGPLAFTNPTLMLAAYDQLELVSEEASPSGEGLTRANRLSMQCPRCRRKTAFVV